MLSILVKPDNLPDVVYEEQHLMPFGINKFL